MEIKINGTLRIEENCAAPTDKGNTQEPQTPIDHSKDVLLDNATTFNELLRVLARNPEVAITGQLEAEQQEGAGDPAGYASSSASESGTCFLQLFGANGVCTPDRSDQLCAGWYPL